MKFWDKVDLCDHENMSRNYVEHVNCSTPYCSGSEEHCLDCKVFITSCGCGFNNGMSGWPNKRRRKKIGG